MTLQTWANNGWLKSHQTSKQEISQLLDIVDRDLNDAKQRKISSDWRFGIAYNAALKLCTILMYIEGFKPEKALAHYRTLQALPLILGSKKEDDADANELIVFVKELKDEVLEWIKLKYPQYM